jgi:FkbM family methyltransferase
MLHFYKTTKFKITFLRVLSTPLFVFFKFFRISPIVKVKRKGIYWNLDLTEAIDYCLWLTGDYEPELTKSFKEKIRPGDIILDIGANSGIHTLFLASLVGDNGHVHALEATEWGLTKIKNHLELNPQLKSRVTLHHVFLTDESEKKLDQISASWKINASSKDPERNPLDQGFPKSTLGSRTITLDEWSKINHLSKVNYIKLDVDGNEVSILRGGLKFLHSYGPAVYMELSPIHYENQSEKFQDQILLIQNLGYKIFSLCGDSFPRDPKEIEITIPRGVLVNVLGVRE